MGGIRTATTRMTGCGGPPCQIPMQATLPSKLACALTVACVLPTRQEYGVRFRRAETGRGSAKGVPGAAQGNEEAATLDEESGQGYALPHRAGAHHSTVNCLAADCVLVNVHPLLSDPHTLHHQRAAHSKEIGAPGRDGARL